MKVSNYEKEMLIINLEQNIERKIRLLLDMSDKIIVNNNCESIFGLPKTVLEIMILEDVGFALLEMKCSLSYFISKKYNIESYDSETEERHEIEGNYFDQKIDQDDKDKLALLAIVNLLNKMYNEHNDVLTRYQSEDVI